MKLVPGAPLASCLCGCGWSLPYALVPKPGLTNLSFLALAKRSSTAGSLISLSSHSTCYRTPTPMPGSSPLTGCTGCMPGTAVSRKEERAAELWRAVMKTPFSPCNTYLGLTLQCLKCNIYTVFSKSLRSWLAYTISLGTFRNFPKAK